MDNTLFEYKKSLDKAVADESDESILDILKVLRTAKVTKDSLKATKIGVVVNKLGKSANADISNASKEIVRCWKDDVSAAAAAAAASEVVTPKENKILSKSNSISDHMETVSANVNKGSLKVPGRVKIVEMFLTHLVAGCDANVEVSERSVGSLALSIEHSIHKILPFDCNLPANNKGYYAKTRTLVSNMKRNEKLRERLLNGSLLPSELVELSIEELATDSQRAEQADLSKATMDSRRSDYYAKNRADIQKANGINPDTGGEFTCQECKNDKTSHHSLQTRGGDEPMTVYVECLTCGYRWTTE